MSDSATRTRTDPRISRRRRAVARSKRRRMLVRMALAAGLALALWLAFLSPLLAVREVRLAGAEHTEAAEVERAVGLGSDDNLLLLSTDEVERRVERLPWVASAMVDRKLPGTVKVSVTERQAAAVLALGDERFTLDRAGRVLDAGAAGEGLAVVAGLDVSPPDEGDRISSPALRGALAALAALPGKLAGRVEAVLAPTAERITLQLSDGIQVRYGAAEDMDSKNRVLVGLLRRLRDEGKAVAYVDVRVPEAPAVAPVSSGEPAGEAPAP